MKWSCQQLSHYYITASSCCQYLSVIALVIMCASELFVNLPMASGFKLLSDDDSTNQDQENDDANTFHWPTERQNEPAISGVSTVSCWIQKCSDACGALNDEGQCKYKCTPNLQAFTQCITKCVCTQRNVWPETHEDQRIIDCDNLGCHIACRNMKHKKGKCEIKRRRKPQGLQNSAHCNCSD